jgi:hypothetical protein
MAILKKSGRFIIAGGFAALIITAPAVAVPSGPLTLAGTRVLADSSSFDASGHSACTANKTNGSYSLTCAIANPQSAVGSSGMVTEQQLTAQNSTRAH